jgi:hypothetical protein
MEKYAWLFVYFLIAVFIGLIVSKYIQESFIVTTCDAIKDCATCSNQSSCAWCSNSNTCTIADRFGFPIKKECVGNDIVNYPYDCPAGCSSQSATVAQVADNAFLNSIYGSMNSSPQIDNTVSVTSYMGGSSPTPGLPIQAYDASGNPISAYDASGNPIMVVYTENIGGYYDASGNSLKIYDSSGNVLNYPVGGYYDASGNNINKIVPRKPSISNSNLGSGDSGFYYDVNGNSILVSNTNGTFYDTYGNPVNVYDNNGKLVKASPSQPDYVSSPTSPNINQQLSYIISDAISNAITNYLNSRTV